MGMRFSFLAQGQEETRCVQGLGPVVRRVPTHRAAQLYEALGKPDIITVEKESVDTQLLRALKYFCTVSPDPDAIEITQHRAREKAFVQSLGFDVAPFVHCDSVAELPAAIATLSYPVIVKACELGYDGQAQWRLNEAEDLAAFLSQQARLRDFVVEKKIAFDREISLIAARSSRGEFKAYPVTENTHQNGILSVSIAPAQALSDALEAHVHEMSKRLMEAMQYVGVLAIECFVVGEKILINELAPRVHNSGHWTQNGAATSQFENHLRAIGGLPLGETDLHGHAAMVNLLGHAPSQSSLLGADRHVHLYNKTPRAGRKMGHINLLNKNRRILEQCIRKTIESLSLETTLNFGE